VQAQKDQSGDRLLWLAAAGIAFMGLAWLVVAAPWSSPEAEILDEIAIATPDPISIAVEDAVASVAAAPVSSDPLHMAQMAFDAGMLIEPAEYSAWTLFGRVAANTPDNEAALAGLEQVANALLQRADAALEQGRYDDADGIAATIAERLPDFPGLRRLNAEIERASAPPPPPVPTRERPAPQVVVEVDEPDPVDQIPAIHSAFRDAMAENAVLRPAGTSAVDRVNEMLSIAPNHELTIAARDLLVTELLDRSQQSIEALDMRSAQTWIDAAAPLTGDPEQVERAQNQLTQHLITAESQRIVSASDLTQLHSVVPVYPRLPLERGIEGWVELEFVVSPLGLPEEIEVIDASHDRYFRDEAIAAVTEWRYEPVVFMDRASPKRAQTRLVFVLD
jgi:protein TonB